VFWHFAAFMAQHRHTLLAVYAVLPMSMVVVTSAWPTQANTVSLVFPPTWLTTLGDCAFPVAVARAWNDLPPTIRASPLQLTFCQQFKTFLFQTTFY